MVDEVSFQGPGQDPAKGDGVPHSSASLSGWVDSFPLDEGGGFELTSDLIGIRRIFYSLKSDCLHAGSTARMVRLAAELPARLDAARARRAARGLLQHGTSLFEGISKVRPGFCLAGRSYGLVLKRALSPPDFLPRAATLEPEQAAMKLRGLLREAVIASFAPGQTAFLLSGGLDSTALVAIAADAGLSPLVAYSFYTGLPGDESELGRAEAVAARFGASLTTVRISPETLPSVFLSAVRSMEDLAWSPLPAAKFEAHRFIAADGFRRVISGLGADEILAGDPPALRSAAPVGSATPLASGQARVFREVLSELTVPAEVRPAQAHGLSVFAPYLHPAVVAFSSMLPMHMRTDGHLGKLALRWALRQLLPDDIRLQPKVARPLSLSSAPEKVRSAWIEVFSSLLQDGDTLDLAGVSKDETAGFLYALREGPYSVESERMLFRMHSLSLLAGSI